MKLILKSYANIATIYQGKKEKKNDPILTRKKIIYLTHKRDKQVIDVDLGKKDGAQTCAHIKKTPFVIPSMKGVNASKYHLKKKSTNSSRGKERTA